MNLDGVYVNADAENTLEYIKGKPLDICPATILGQMRRENNLAELAQNFSSGDYPMIRWASEVLYAGDISVL